MTNLIFRTIETYFELEEGAIESNYRKQPRPDARVLASAIVEQYIELTDNEYGIAFNCNHSLRHYRRHRFEDLMQVDKSFAANYNKCLEMVCSVYKAVPKKLWNIKRHIDSILFDEVTEFEGVEFTELTRLAHEYNQELNRILTKIEQK